jgi:hypothetical protein
MSLIAELCRVFNARPEAIGCAMRHRQITVDGYVMRPEYDRRWSERQLRGRMAALNFNKGGTKREARLYG